MHANNAGGSKGDNLSHDKPATGRHTQKVARR